jgi:hypothetical protein
MYAQIIFVRSNISCLYIFTLAASSALHSRSQQLRVVLRRRTKQRRVNDVSRALIG